MLSLDLNSACEVLHLKSVFEDHSQEGKVEEEEEEEGEDTLENLCRSIDGTK